MESGHYIEKCVHGIVLSQCRCPGPRTEYVIECPPSCGPKSVVEIEDLRTLLAQRDARFAELDRFVTDTQTRLCAVIEARDARIAEFESLARMVVDGQLTETEHERGIYRRGFRELLAAAKGE